MRNLFLPLMTLLFIVACSTTVSQKDKTPAAPSSAGAQKLYQDAQAAFDRGQDSEASGKLKQLIKEPVSDVTDDALLLLGRIEFRKKNFQPAYGYFEQIFNSNFQSPRDTEARIFAVQCLLSLDKLDAADKLIKNSLALNPPAREKSYLLEAQLPILLRRDSQLETFEALAFLAQNHPNSNSKERYRDLAKNFIDSRLKSEELKEVSDDSNMGELRIEAMFQYAMDLVEKNDLDGAKSYFNRIVYLAPSSYLGQQASNMVNQLDARAYVEAKSIGVVLPLSGPYGSIGQQTLRGLQQALGISGSTSKYNFRLIVQDTAGVPETATKAVEELVFKDHVMTIVGGLSSKTVTAEATRAQELGVPFISLSQKPGLTKIGPFIYTNSITPKLQVEHIVSYAIDRLKLKRFAVLYPNDRYGVEFANLFWDEVQRRGGKVAAAQTYAPGETDFKASVKKMIGTYYTEDRSSEYQQLLREWKKKNPSKRKQPPETLLPPLINFDALFIPDDPRALGQIAPMLAFNDVTNIYLLGTNLWNSPEFVTRGQNFVERSVFVDVFLADSPEFLDSAFYKEFRQIYKERPGSFAIQGFDAGRLIINAMKENPRNRIDFLRMMSATQKVQGATSMLNMSQDREVDRQLMALSVKKNQIIRLE